MAAVLQVRDEPKYRTGLNIHMKAAAHAANGHVQGMFTGLHGLLAACKYVMRVESRYDGLLRKCADAVLALKHQSVRAPLLPEHYGQYDLIAGRAGEAIALATVLLPEDARGACDYLSWLVGVNGRLRCPHPLRPEDGAIDDLGMAHGLAGVIAALSIAAPREAPYDDAIKCAIEQLCSFRHPSQPIGWPSSVREGRPSFGRSAWCYGTPGCAAALMCASDRFGTEDEKDIARQSLLDLESIGQSRWLLPDNALCHGRSGNALIFAAAAQTTSERRFEQISRRLLSEIVEEFDKDSAFGFRAWTGEGYGDSANLLEGSAGVGLTLLTLAGLCDPSWMALFGMPILRGRLDG